MGEPRSIEQRMGEAQSRWPGLRLRKKTHDEAAGPCPFCKDGEDRFLVFEDGGFWCRQCGETGWLDDDDRQLTEQELTEIRLRRLERRQAEHERRLTKLEEMHGLMHVADYYHGNLADRHNDAFEYWLGEGIEIETIERYKLGYCSRCPTDRRRRSSYTIPVIIRGKLYNIRHRLRGIEGGGKYRPHMAGLPSVLFNADYLYQDLDQIVIVEGEKKSMVAQQTGFPNVGIMGKSGFDPRWARKFDGFRMVYVALDPDALDDAAEIAAMFEGRGRVVVLPDKLDDLIVIGGADRDDIRWFLTQGRPV